MVDVARQAGVSLKTVSRVVNAESGVNAETATRVHDVIGRLGFRRHDGASSLRRQRTASIGLLLEDVGDPFYSSITRAVEEVARQHRSIVLAGSSDEDPDRERRLALAFCARRVDGLLVVPAGDDHGYLVPEMRAGTAAVFMDRPAGNIDADTVLVDNVGGSAQAVHHLLSVGHRRIGFIGDAEAIFTAQQRLAGFRTAMTDAGRSADAQPVAMGPHTVESVAAVLESWRACRWPVGAVITGNNRLTVLALRALHGHGDVPALVGFDDFELADLLGPPVTVIAQDPQLMGHTAAELLFRRLGGDRGPAERVVLPTRLIIRGCAEARP